MVVDTGLSFIRKVRDRGAITVPADVLEAAEVQEGDIVEFAVVRVVRKANGGRK